MHFSPCAKLGHFVVMILSMKRPRYWFIYDSFSIRWRMTDDSADDGLIVILVAGDISQSAITGHEYSSVKRYCRVGFRR